MPLAIFFLVFAGALAIALLYPHIRVLALAVAALCAVLLAVIVVDQVSESDRRVARLTPADITVTEVALTPGARYLTLSGWAMNTSDEFRVRDFTLLSRVYDCPTADAPLSDCIAIGEDTGLARVDIPPGQARPFEAVLGFTSDYQHRGVLHWEHELTEVRATDDPLR